MEPKKQPSAVELVSMVGEGIPRESQEQQRKTQHNEIIRNIFKHNVIGQAAESAGLFVMVNALCSEETRPYANIGAFLYSIGRGFNFLGKEQRENYILGSLEKIKLK